MNNKAIVQLYIIVNCSEYTHCNVCAIRNRAMVIAVCRVSHQITTSIFSFELLSYNLWFFFMLPSFESFFFFKNIDLVH